MQSLSVNIQVDPPEVKQCKWTPLKWSILVDPPEVITEVDPISRHVNIDMNSLPEAITEVDLPRSEHGSGPPIEVNTSVDQQSQSKFCDAEASGRRGPAKKYCWASSEVCITNTGYALFTMKLIVFQK